MTRRLSHIAAIYNERDAVMTLIEHCDDGSFNSSDVTGAAGATVYAFYETKEGRTVWLLSRPMSFVSFETDETSRVRGAFVITPKDGGGAPPPATFWKRAMDRGCSVYYPRARERGAA